MNSIFFLSFFRLYNLFVYKYIQFQQTFRNYRMNFVQYNNVHINSWFFLSIFLVITMFMFIISVLMLTFWSSFPTFARRLSTLFYITIVVLSSGLNPILSLSLFHRSLHVKCYHILFTFISLLFNDMKSSEYKSHQYNCR